MMGSESYSDEKPIHEVELSSFYLGQYPVSQGLWEAVLGNNPASFPGTELPVESVSWKDCQEFLEKLNEKLGLDGSNAYRLPTESEWEYAARGGKYAKGAEYAGAVELKEVGWFGYFEEEWNMHKQTEVLGRRIPNELGLYDMSGNVYEWCWDWYGDYPSAPLKDPQGPQTGSSRVLRGGSWITDAVICRVAYRSDNPPALRDRHYGLRLARTVL